MNFLTILPILESITDMTRTVVATKTDKGEAISYHGTINSVTVNTDNPYTNVNQLCLLHDTTDLYLYINYATRRNRTKYKLTDINTLVIT